MTQTAVKRPGQRATLGDEIGFAMEPDYLYARLVGILKDPKAAKWAIVRRYQPGDRVGVPTGEYYRVWLLVPWTGEKGPM